MDYLQNSFCLKKAVFALIVAFRITTINRILLGFGALFLLLINQETLKLVKIQKPIFTFVSESNKVYEKSLKKREITK